MKSRRTKRSLLWGLLLTTSGGALTGTTHAVRAESVTSSALAPAAGDGDGSPVKPYFWTSTADEMVKQAEEHQAIYSMPGYAYGLGGTLSHALSARALD